MPLVGIGTTHPSLDERAGPGVVLVPRHSEADARQLPVPARGLSAGVGVRDLAAGLQGWMGGLDGLERAREALAPVSRGRLSHPDVRPAGLGGQPGVYAHLVLLGFDRGLATIVAIGMHAITQAFEYLVGIAAAAVLAIAGRPGRQGG